MLTVHPSEGEKQVIAEQYNVLLDLRGAGLELVEKVLARKELWIDDFEEFMRALRDYEVT
jgi:hypothetical protein